MFPGRVFVNTRHIYQAASIPLPVPAARLKLVSGDELAGARRLSRRLPIISEIISGATRSPHPPDLSDPLLSQ
jgi:hypothetical protein